MDSVGRAMQDLSKYRTREVAFENELIDSLNEPQAVASGTRRSAQAIDKDLAVLRQQMEETAAMIEYQEKKRHVMNVADLRQICFSSQRVLLMKNGDGDGGGMSPGVTDDDLVPYIVQWSDSNYKQGITGILLATSKCFFGILEGPSAEVTQLFERKILLPAAQSQQEGERATNNVHDSNNNNDDDDDNNNRKRHFGKRMNHSCMLLRSMAIEERQFQSGLQLHAVSDGIVASVMEFIQANTLSARIFCTPRTIGLLERGGDPLQAPPQTSVFYVMSCTLDSLCGAVHHLERYSEAATRFEAIVAGISDGVVVERFGSQMVAVFPKIGSPAQIIQGAKDFVSDIKFAVVVLSCGPVHLSSLPSVIACGAGLRDNVKLLYFAEHIRRPLVITTPVYDACSKAVHRFDDFSEGNVKYHTLQCFINTRLEVAPEADIAANAMAASAAAYRQSASAYVPQDETSVPPRTSQNTNPNIILPPTPDEVNEGRKAAAVVKGSVTDTELHSKFRSLDIANVGWISKDAFRKHVAAESAFPLFGHDLKKMDQWLDRCNALGDSRLSFSEFSVLMLRLQQQ